MSNHVLRWTSNDEVLIWIWSSITGSYMYILASFLSECIQDSKSLSDGATMVRTCVAYGLVGWC